MKYTLMGKASFQEITSFCELPHLILQRREQGHKNSSGDGAVEDWCALQ